MNEVIKGTEREMRSQIADLVDRQELREAVLKEAKETALKQAAHILDNTIPPPPELPNINVESDEQDEYMLILEYLQSTGLEFTPAVLRFESQHPKVAADRKALAKHFGLQNYSRKPLLVQLIEERLQQLEGSDTD